MRYIEHRFSFAAESRRIISRIAGDPRFATDRLASSILDFGWGRAAFTAATQLRWYQRVNLFGTAGRIEIAIPLNASACALCRLWHQPVSASKEVTFDLGSGREWSK